MFGIVSSHHWERPCALLYCERILLPITPVWNLCLCLLLGSQVARLKKGSQKTWKPHTQDIVCRSALSLCVSLYHRAKNIDGGSRLIPEFMKIIGTKGSKSLAALSASSCGKQEKNRNNRKTRLTWAYPYVHSYMQLLISPYFELYNATWHSRALSWLTIMYGGPRFWPLFIEIRARITLLLPKRVDPLTQWYLHDS